MKARLIHVHREVNVGKLNSLTLLYGGYRTYLQACINLLLEKRCTKMPRSSRLHFFQGHPDLTVHLRRGAEAHALSIVCSWFSLKYSTVIKKESQSTQARGRTLGRASQVPLHDRQDSPKLPLEVRRRYAARRRSPAFSLSKESLQDDLESRTVTVLDSNSSSKV